MSYRPIIKRGELIGFRVHEPEEWAEVTPISGPAQRVMTRAASTYFVSKDDGAAFGFTIEQDENGGLRDAIYE